MSGYVWDLSGTDKQCASYAPGHLIHWIHFNHSMREPSAVVPVTAVVDDNGLVHIEGDDVSLVRWNHRPALLRDALHRFGENIGSAGMGDEDGGRRGRCADGCQSFGLLHQVLGAAVENYRIPRNPCDGVRLPKLKHADRGYLNHAQVAALAAAVDSHPEVIRFLAYTGLRWGEMAALRVQDFDILRRRVNVSRSVTECGSLVWSTPKTGERRSVRLPASLADELSALMVGKARDDLVFTGTRGAVLRDGNFRNRVFNSAVQLCQMADDTFPHITPMTYGTRRPAWRSAPGPT
jgi:integrase